MNQYIFNILLIILFSSSCASYVQKIHAGFRNEEVNKARQQTYYTPRNGQRNIRDPKTLQYLSKSGLNPSLGDESQRSNYLNMRSKKDDLKDNDQSLSLWSDKNSESFLFVTNNQKKRGDIVIINVNKKIDKIITEEVKRTIPPSANKDASGATNSDTTTKTDTETQKSDSKDKNESDNFITDKISTQVIDEINNDYLLVRGRKELNFQGRKRFIEIQGLVSQKDVDIDDQVKGDKILEPKVEVLRY